jgi:hypothetical protein
MIEGPYSSYSALEIHTGWKTPREAKMLPPSQFEEFFSGRRVTLVLDPK